MFNLENHNKLLESFVKLDCNIFIPNCKDKNTIITSAYFFNKSLSKANADVVQQVYLLNKLYDKQITPKKRELDETIESFVENFAKVAQNKFSVSILKVKYRELCKNISEFLKLENIVKSNIAILHENQTKFDNFVCENKQILGENCNIHRQIFNPNLPSVKFCKIDVDKKIDYINNLYTQTINTNLKGRFDYDK